MDVDSCPPFLSVRTARKPCRRLQDVESHYCAKQSILNSDCQQSYICWTLKMWIEISASQQYITMREDW